MVAGTSPATASRGVGVTRTLSALSCFSLLQEVSATAPTAAIAINVSLRMMETGYARN